MPINPEAISTIISDHELEQLTQSVAHKLTKLNWTLTVAESCTGGWLAKCCTDITGSSLWFDRGFVTYSNQSKCDLLKVQKPTLEQFGAVSEQTAYEMAQGALRNSSANISISITGIAGPTGGSKDKPIGTVCFTIMTDSCAKSSSSYFKGSRDSVRRQAVATALTLILKNARE